MQVTNSGSVRVDLVGGTLDLEPINLIIPKVVTLNVATSLKAEVQLTPIDNNKLVIISEDYKKTYEYERSEVSKQKLLFSNDFGEMSFVLQIINLFEFQGGLEIKLKSGAPAGSGLGGSSAMGVTLYHAMEKMLGLGSSVTEIVQQVKGVEGRILNQGIPGYQDYFPALLGGVLALRGFPGSVEYEQIYSPELVEFLENHITLVYSGISRDSGINNWEVYKGFFDKNERIQAGLKKIAHVSHLTYEAIKNKKYHEILELIGLEGESRKALSANIVPKEVDDFYFSLKSQRLVHGLKMCGAGGGGCFILTHDKENKPDVVEQIAQTSFKVLDFKIQEPIE
ncbi:MAG: hypothetical protein CME62_17565 [Halobacteriovoraceae bacterium]|nr:hypothetical protein [Halobacteriovoraceae bacterium]|tara:strand:+ start:29929 stop:30945 length:1017 start_codon:yes stop_codon:yes gene_type:complete